MPNGNGGGGGGGFDFGGIFDSLLGELAAAIEAIIAFLQALVVAIVNALNFLFGGLENVFGFSFQSLGEVWRSFTKLLDEIFKAVVLASLKKLWALYQALAAWAKKLKAWLDKFHALMRKYQIMALRRVINLIQRVRQILVIFKVFHLKFAQKLDNWLAGIEGKLISRISAFARKTNEVIAWINVIADPIQAYRKGLLFGAYGRILRGFGAALAAIGLTKYFPWLARVLGPGVPAQPWSNQVQRFQAESASGGGDLGDVQAQFNEWVTKLDQGFGTGS